MMNEFVQKFTEAAYAQGVSNLEFYFETEKNVAVNAHEGRAFESKLCDTTFCYVEGEYQGNAGAIYVEDFSEELFEEEIAFLKAAAEMKNTPFHALKLTTLDHKKEWKLDTLDQMTDYVLSAEKKVMEAHPQLKKIDSCHLEEKIREIRIQNDRGDCMEDSMKSVTFHMHASAEKDGVVQTSGNGATAVSMEELKLPELFEEAATEVCGMLDAKPVVSGRYPVILKNSVINEMLSMYMKGFCGDFVNKKLSKFVDRKGESIAAEIVNLVEDPLLHGGVNNRTFDDEGTPVSKKSIIENGVLKLFLYNESEAQKANEQSTGNGFKTKYKGNPEIGVTNLKLEGQEKTIEELLREMKDGLYITRCDGMFAGADVVSGDFALISKGYLVKDGEIADGVTQITVAGNFYDMLKEIKAIGNDYLTSLRPSGAFIAPSVFVKELVVSGL